MKIRVITVLILLFSSLAFYSIPPRGEAAFAPVRIVQIAAIPLSQNCDAGVMDQLCSSITNFLNEESVKADAEAKACKKNCNWKKRKDELIDGARKKAKESCAKGETPDINTVNMGLDGNAKARLKSLYDNNSRLFDGTAKLAASKDLDVKSGQTPALTGKGGQVTDLKTFEPNTPKLNSTTEFSLAGKSNAPLAAVASPKTLAASVAPANTAAQSQKAGAVAAAPRTGSPAAAAAQAAGAGAPQTAEAASSTAGATCQPIRIICADKDAIMIAQNMAISAVEMALAQSKSARDIVKKRCDSINDPTPAQAKACTDVLKQMEGEITKTTQALECLKSQRASILAKCGGTCPEKCACTITDCKDTNSGINSGACTVACKNKKVCTIGMEQCPKNWDRTYWNPIDRAIDWAWLKRGDTTYGIKGCGTNPLFCGKRKCNLFVADAFIKGGGVDFPYREKYGLFETTPVSANTLAIPKEVVPHFPVIPGGEKALQMGDIVAIFNPNGSGHTGIYIGNNEVIQAGRFAVVITTLEEFKGERKEIVIRRYTP